MKEISIIDNKLGKYPQFAKRKRKAWVAQLCCAQETGKPEWQNGQNWQARKRRITPLRVKTAITKKLLLPRRRLLQYSSLFMAPAGVKF